MERERQWRRRDRETMEEGREGDNGGGERGRPWRGERGRQWRRRERETMEEGREGDHGEGEIGRPWRRREDETERVCELDIEDDSSTQDVMTRVTEDYK